MALTTAEVAALDALWAELGKSAHHYVPCVKLGQILADLQNGGGLPDPLTVNAIQAKAAGGPMAISTSDGTPYMSLSDLDALFNEPAWAGRDAAGLNFRSGVNGSIKFSSSDGA